jgi:hypothetical protein
MKRSCQPTRPIPRGADVANQGDSGHGSFLFRLARAELRRYAYLRTGRLDAEDVRLATVETAEPGLAAEVEAARALGPEGAVIRTWRDGSHRQFVIVGYDEPGLLFGAYHLCAQWGVGFHLHGDSIPDTLIDELPEVNADRKPLFATRGLHPFHNFPEGPDGWNLEAYRLHLGQMTKMGMNFIGFHAYSSTTAGFEPQVWMGLPEDVLEDGRVRRAYASFNWHPGCGTWGYAKAPPPPLPLEADRLLGPEAYADCADAEGAPELFHRIGQRWRHLFTTARKRGLRCCLGLEIPLVMPASLRDALREQGLDPDSPAAHKLVWRGIFRRIKRTHPLDMFWLYVPENWVWQQVVPEDEVRQTVEEVRLVQEALREEEMALPLGIMGWVLGPRNDPLALDRYLPEGIPLAALSPQVGHLPIQPQFAFLQKRPGWAVPWLEDDPRLTVPQLWAGRMLRDAADAWALGCKGLLGLHWRTRGLAPQMVALAQSAWDQRAWNPCAGQRFTQRELEGFMSGEGQGGGRMERWHASPEKLETSLPKDLFATASVGATFYRVHVPAGQYRVRCHLSEFSGHQAMGARRMSLAVNHRILLDKVDVVEQVGRWGVLTAESSTLVMKEEGEIELFLRQVIGETVLNAIEIMGHTVGFNQFEGVEFVRRINCGGPELHVGGTVWEAGAMRKESGEPRPRFVDPRGFYQSWARTEFGEDAGPEAAKVFSEIDGHLPCITFMKEGPGNCTPDERPWEMVAPEYAFVDRLAALSHCRMGPMERDRFDFWVAHFSAFRAAAKVRCAVARTEDIVELESAWRALYQHLIDAVRSPGDIGTLLSIEHQWRLKNLAKGAPDLDEPFAGAPRIVVPVAPLNLSHHEAFVLHARVVGLKEPPDLVVSILDPEKATVATRPMNPDGAFGYRVEVDPRDLPDLFTYWITAAHEEGDLSTLVYTALVEPPEAAFEP